MTEYLTWRKSSFSTGDGGGNECVELATLPDGGVAVRDSKPGRTSPVLTFTRGELTAFVHAVKAGDFDNPA
ncbi:DUF397 domain-containing protein [Saccharothrix isguenensis]